MKIDLYTKMLLTVIAIALWGILLKPIFMSDRVSASTAVVDVNIKEVGGKRVDRIIDVNLERINNRTFSGNLLPVEIKK
ncbi:MAG TPA: hypothetical protein VNN20_14685 [Thermodesulfobacteriota bacterium]|nr:hypothetical protein [Thermodesulfobacteriota bacterium]